MKRTTMTLCLVTPSYRGSSNVLFFFHKPASPTWQGVFAFILLQPNLQYIGTDVPWLSLSRASKGISKFYILFLSLCHVMSPGHPSSWNQLVETHVYLDEHWVSGVRHSSPLPASWSSRWMRWNGSSPREHGVLKDRQKHETHQIRECVIYLLLCIQLPRVFRKTGVKYARMGNISVL